MKHPEKNVSGPQIAAARKRHRPPLTQLELSKRVRSAGTKLDRAAIAKVENGLRGVLDYELVGLAKALGVSISALVKRKK